MPRATLLTVKHCSATDSKAARLRCCHDTSSGNTAWYVPMDYALNQAEQCLAIAEGLAALRGDIIVGDYGAANAGSTKNGPYVIWYFMLARPHYPHPTTY
jgi:hypothetical protein